MASAHQILEIQTQGHAANGNESYVKKIFNVWHFLRSGAPAFPDKAAAVGAFKTTVFAPLLLCQSVSMIYDVLKYRWLDDNTDPYVAEASTATGITSGDSLPSALGVGIQLKTGIRSRNAAKGAKKIGMIAESDTLLDELTSGAVTKFETFMTAYLSGFSNGGFTYTPFIVSTKLSSLIIPNDTVVGNPVTALVLNPVLCLMKRRRQPVSQ
jgi:hypothetical protein